MCLGLGWTVRTRLWIQDSKGTTGYSYGNALSGFKEMIRKEGILVRICPSSSSSATFSSRQYTSLSPMVLRSAAQTNKQTNKQIHTHTHTHTHTYTRAHPDISQSSLIPLPASSPQVSLQRSRRRGTPHLSWIGRLLCHIRILQETSVWLE